jgi:CBS domain-containing protein
VLAQSGHDHRRYSFTASLTVCLASSTTIVVKLGPCAPSFLPVRRCARLVALWERCSAPCIIFPSMRSCRTTTNESVSTRVSVLPISTRTVLVREGAVQRTLQVCCPMHDKTVSIERCVACPMCARLDANEGSVMRPSVACMFERRRPGAGAGAALSRFASLVRLDAISLVLPIPPPVAPLPVVDEQLHLVGVLEPGPHVRVDDGALGLAVEEHAPIARALTHMARRHVRRLPVVARDGTVVGVLDDLDAMRVLRSAPA